MAALAVPVPSHKQTLWFLCAFYKCMSFVINILQTLMLDQSKENVLVVIANKVKTHNFISLAPFWEGKGYD